MAKRSERPAASGKVGTLLPNAPLTEVVFEFRWRLIGDAGVPDPFRMDPGFHVFAEKFSNSVAKLGFAHSKKMSADPSPPGYSVDRRFYRSDDKPFPILQIGPGIFAANESTEYDWHSYREMSIVGLKHVLSAYPKMDTFKVEPNYLELRYIDTFDADLVSGKDFLTFLQENTTISVNHPALVSASLEAVSAGQLALNFKTKLPKNGTFAMMIGTAKRDGIPSIIMQTKVISKGDPLPAGKSTADQIKFVKKWLDDSHAVTSSYFKGVIEPSLMRKFSTK